MQLKSKMETMTGIPPGSQRLRLKAPGRADQWVEGDDSSIGDWGLMKGCEIEVCNWLLLARLLACGSRWSEWCYVNAWNMTQRF